MSLLSTTKYRNSCLILSLFFTLALQTSVLAQTIVRVDGDNGSANPVGQGNAWGANAFKYLQDALAFSELNPGAEDLWVAATIPINPYRPSWDAANPGGTGDPNATFLLDFNNVTLLGGFLGNETDPDDRDPAFNITVLSGVRSSCGESDAGNCFLAKGTPGCENAACCEAVCAVDPDCCSLVWDQGCVDLALDVCGSCGDPEAGNCFNANGTPGCNDADCCRLVCEVDPFCCEDGWDSACASLADDVCGVCGEPDSGDCLTETPGIGGCDDLCGGLECPRCCALVCATVDPGCCNFEWDEFCALAAVMVCVPPLEGNPRMVYHVVTADGVDNSVRIDGFTITDGLADVGSNGLGGGMFIFDASPSVVRITFVENGAPVHGGGAMAVEGTSNPMVVNTSFIANTGEEAGALHTEGGFAGGTFVNCLFIGNRSIVEGGAINPGGGETLSLINCTFADNTVDAINGGGAISTEMGAFTVKLINCILWGNEAGGQPNQIKDSPGAVTVSYSDVEGEPVWPGIGNINDDPLFIDPDGPDNDPDTFDDNDYRLDALSPCIDMGDLDETVIPMDEFDVDQDGDTDERTPDLDLNDRLIDEDGSCSVGIVDMGAYEAPTCCPWDMDNSGGVGASDLLTLLDAWGSDPGGPPDFDCDGNVGASDLLALLANWGACPCGVSTTTPTIEQEMAAHCLTMDDWDKFVDKMQNGTEAEKENYLCWMIHYLDECSRCFCTGQANCPGPDPYNG